MTRDHSPISGLLSFAGLAASHLTTNGFGSPNHRGENATLANNPRAAISLARARANPIRLNLSVNTVAPTACAGFTRRGQISFRDQRRKRTATVASGISVTDGGHRTPSISRPTSIAVFEEILRKVNAPGRVSEVARHG